MLSSVTLHDKTFVPFIEPEALQAKNAALGAAITADYKDKKPLFLSILNGAFMFAADLLRCVDTEAEITFVKLASYKGTASTGSVQTVLGLDTPLKDRHIVIVEDIVDTGNTLHNFLKELDKEGPASVAIVACFFKPEALQYPIDIKYCGFEIPTKFIVGYGLDYDGLGRNLPAVYQLKTD